MSAARLNVLLICGGKYHDFDFARLELLKLLHEHAHMRVQVAQDYAAVDQLATTDLLITYTCDVVPDEAQQRVLRAWLESGKRWLALHATNSIIEFVSLKPLRIRTPDAAPDFMALCGSQFVAHPPIGRFRVEVTDPTHPLVEGIEAFETTDELYLCRYSENLQTLLHCYYEGTTPEFEQTQWDGSQPHPVLYLHPVGRGEVVYFTLGHCRGNYDMRPLMEHYPNVDRCSWEQPQFREILRRCIEWSGRRDS
ncbi:MAG: ThuA domain-containing protein [Gammaproteobacteria bacterium]